VLDEGKVTPFDDLQLLERSGVSPCQYVHSSRPRGRSKRRPPRHSR
jgi:hypothetical protein